MLLFLQQSQLVTLQAGKLYQFVFEYQYTRGVVATNGARVIDRLRFALQLIACF